VPPAHESFHADDALVGEPDDGLVQQVQLAVIERLVQLGAQLGVLQDLGRHPRRVADRPALAAFLARVHRDVGVAEQRAGVVARRSDGNADACLDQQLAPVYHERPGQAVENPPGDGVHRMGAGVLQQHGELVTTKARHRVLRADAALDTPGHRSEQRVAHVVAERVVDCLEIIKVDKQHGKGVAGRGAQRGVDPLAEQRAVGQLGQRVVGRLVAQLVFALAQPVHEPCVVGESHELPHDHERGDRDGGRHHHVPAGVGRANGGLDQQDIGGGDRGVWEQTVRPAAPRGPGGRLTRCSPLPLAGEDDEPANKWDEDVADPQA
jgi:hypothetical protein